MGMAAYLLHVLGDRILLQELCALACVETFRVSEELTFKVLFVDGQRRTFGEGVLFVQAQLNWRTRGEEILNHLLQLVTNYTSRTIHFINPTSRKSQIYSNTDERQMLVSVYVTTADMGHRGGHVDAHGLRDAQRIDFKLNLKGQRCNRQQGLNIRLKTSAVRFTSGCLLKPENIYLILPLNICL